jgi:predicted acyltransferase
MISHTPRFNAEALAGKPQQNRCFPPAGTDMEKLCQSPARLGSLDMLRGIAIAGMILVNNPGSWQHMYPWLRHAVWTGYGPADLVFPFFLFAVGASQSFSLAVTAHTGRLPIRLFTRIFRRTAILFLLGLFLNAFPGMLKLVIYAEPVDCNALRIMGVLQRIALVYFTSSIFIALLSRRLLWLTTALLLAGYGAVLAVFPASLSPDNNPALFIDRLILGSGHLYGGGLDPEGIFSSVSAITTVLLGYQAGLFLRQSPHTSRTSFLLFCAGGAVLACGYAAGTMQPICKDLWNGPYVLVSAGWAALSFSICHELQDVRNLRSPGIFFRIMGRNALFLFFASGITARILLTVTITRNGREAHLWNWLYESLFTSWMGRNDMSSFALAAVYLAAWWLALYLLDRRGWHFRA